MKKFLALPFTLMLILALNSCKNTIDLAAEYQEVTVVYGLLSKTDTAHYIKINKGFLDKNTNALILAKNSDSSNFGNLVVTVGEYNATNNLITTHTLQKVNLVAENIIKDTGIFYNQPAFAYKFKTPLNPNNSYRLKILNNATGKIVESTTKIIADDNINFTVYRPTPTFFLAFNNTYPYKFQWRAPAQAKLFDVVLRFNYTEKNIITNQLDTLYKDWLVLSGIRANTVAGGQVLEQDIAGNSFYTFLKNNIPVKPNVERRYDSADVFLTAGGEILSNYIDITQSQGGITANQIKPEYTNISGPNAYGIFSTRVKKSIMQIPYTSATYDSLRIGSSTSNLNFVGLVN
jgi:hypothetical protein